MPTLCTTFETRRSLVDTLESDQFSPAIVLFSLAAVSTSMLTNPDDAFRALPTIASSNNYPYDRMSELLSEKCTKLAQLTAGPKRGIFPTINRVNTAFAAVCISAHVRTQTPVHSIQGPVHSIERRKSSARKAS